MAKVIRRFLVMAMAMQGLAVVREVRTALAGRRGVVKVNQALRGKGQATVGQFEITTVLPHVRCLTLATVLGAYRQWVCRWAPFDPASGIDGESLPWGPCGSSMHYEGWVSHPPTSSQWSPSLTAQSPPGLPRFRD